MYKTIKTKILSIRKGAEEVEEISPGASISIETELDPFLTKADSLTGCIASREKTLPEISSNIKIKTNLFKEISGTSEHQKTEAIKMNEMLMLSVNTTISVGVVEKIKNNEINLRLNIPIVALQGENLGIARNIGGHWRLIGWGEIIL